MSKYIHKYTPWWKGGGGGSYDDTAIKRRITALESGKQNVLVRGDGIILLNDTISAVNILNDTRESSTTVWSSSKVKSLFEGLQGQVDISIVETRPDPSVAVEKTMYYVGTSSPYHIWFFVNDEYTDFGTTELDLSDYFTKDEVNELLDLKVDKVSGKSLVSDTDIAQITTNKADIFDVKDELYGIKDGLNIDSFSDVETALDDKQDKLTDSALSSIGDSTTVSSVDASAKTNKTFALSKLWDYVVSKVSTVISSSSTDAEIPSAKSVYDYVKVEPFTIAGIGTKSNQHTIKWQNIFKVTIGSQMFLTGSFEFYFDNAPLIEGYNGRIFQISNVTFMNDFVVDAYYRYYDHPINVYVFYDGGIGICLASDFAGHSSASFNVTFNMVPVASVTNI